MLKFTLDSQKSVVLKQSEYFQIDNIETNNTIILQYLRRSSIEDIYIIKDHNVSGIHLVEELSGSVGDYTFIDDNKILLLQNSSKLLKLLNFYVIVTSKEQTGIDKYLFEESNGTQSIINSNIGDDIVTVIQKIFITQEIFNYRKIIINQIDLSPYYGLRIEFFKFQYYTEELGDNPDLLTWYNSLSLESLVKNESIPIWVKVAIPKLGLTTINRDIQIHYSQYEY